MKRALLVLLAVVGFISPVGRLYAQPVPKTGTVPAKPVSLIWFPRFSPNGKWLLSAHGHWDGRQGGEVRVWEVSTGKPIHVIVQPRGVRSVCWAPDSAYFVMGGYAGDMRVFDSATGKQLHEANLGTNIEGVAITYDEKRLVATLGSGAIKVFGLPGYQEIQTIKSAHNGGVWGMCLSPDGKLVASCGRDTYVRIQQLSRGQGSQLAPDVRRGTHSSIDPDQSSLSSFSAGGECIAAICWAIICASIAPIAC